MLFLSLRTFQTPRRVAAVLATVLAMGFSALMIQLHAAGSTVFGHVQSITSIGNDTSFMRVGLPLDITATAVVMPDKLIQSQNVKVGDWVLASGRRVSIRDRQLFSAEAVASFGVSASWLASLDALRKRLSETPATAVFLGCAVLVAGSLITAAMTAGIFAAAGGLLMWHGMHVAVFRGWIEMPPFSMFPILAIGVIAGLALGWRSSGGFSSIWQRLLSAALLYWLGPFITARFGWPDVFTYVLVIGSLAFPVISYATIGGFFLHLGLNAKGDGGSVVLLASAATALLNEIVIKPMWSTRTATPFHGAFWRPTVESNGLSRGS